MIEQEIEETGNKKYKRCVAWLRIFFHILL